MSPPLHADPIKRRVDLTLIRDRDHYSRLVMGCMAQARVSIWIATANVKELRIEAQVGTRARAKGAYVSILDLFSTLSSKGVELRLLHAGLPSRAFQAELKAHPKLLSGGLAMRRCPRVHLKMIAVDGTFLYLGSANFTGAGLGAKGEHRRNFETGILTDDDVLLDEMQGTFDALWSGKPCTRCALRAECPAPLDTPHLSATASTSRLHRAPRSKKSAP